jgi:hypothetical protein
MTGTHNYRIYTAFHTGGADTTSSFTVKAAYTWEYKTISISAFAGITAVSTAPTANGAELQFGASVYASATRTVAANSYVQVAQLQLEAGSNATTFSRAGGNIQGELAACQRYYQTSFDLGQTPAHNASYFGEMTLSCVNGGFNTNSYGAILFPTKMRTAPTVNIWNTRNASVSGNSARFYNSGTAYETSSIDMGITTSSSHGMTFKGTNIGASAIVFFGYSASAEL